MEQQNQLVPFDERYGQIRDWLLGEEMQTQLVLALPQGIDAGRHCRQFLTECRKIPKLVECTGESLLGAMMEVAQLGLDIGTRGHAWIIPYKVKGTMTANLLVGYKGMLDLAWRSGKVTNMYGHVVNDGDKFEYAFGSDQFIRHVPASYADRGDITHAYSGCDTVYGGKLMDVMLIEDIEDIRSRARGSDKGPWVTDYPQMCIKTSIRRMLKLAPCSAELGRAIALDEKADAGLPQDLAEANPVDIGPLEPVPDEPTEPDNLVCEKCGLAVDREENHWNYTEGTLVYTRCPECGPRKEE